jgi:AcrR family transcriptional regulator
MSSRVDGRAVRGAETRLRILDAAREVLAERGYSGASTRAVADRAGVPLSLVHYHFGDKRSLLVDVLERENDRLLERQQALYDEPGRLAEKWRTACAYLDEDIRSGYVRVLWELWAAGLADDALAERWRAATAGWRDLLTSVFERWAEQIDRELPFRPRALASLVANVFQGMEVELLAGVSEDDSPHREVLEVLGDLIARTEARSAPHPT